MSCPFALALERRRVFMEWKGLNPGRIRVPNPWTDYLTLNLFPQVGTIRFVMWDVTGLEVV